METNAMPGVTLGMRKLWQAWRLTLVALAALLSSLPASAAEVSCERIVAGPLAIPWAQLNPSGRTPRPDTCLVILIKGTISAGDSERFAHLLKDNHPFVNQVKLWSSGGLVEEAMKIGRLVRKGLLETRTATETFMPKLSGPDGKGRLPGSGREDTCIGAGCHCASACFLIWAAGVSRSGDAIGLHRPTSASTTFVNMPPDRASVLYRKLLSDIRDYLVEMEVPRRFVEIMTDTSSNEIRWLDYDEATSMNDVPSIAEWVALTCGAMTKAELDTESAIGAEISWPKNVSQRDRMLHDMLENKRTKIRECAFKRIWNARDAIN